MPQQTSRSFWIRLLDSKALLIGEIVVLLFFLSALGKEIANQYTVRQEINELEEDVAALEQRNTELGSLIDYFQSDFYREREARLKLGLQREGETALALPGRSAPEETTEPENRERGAVLSAETRRIADGESNPQRWWSYFFDQ